MSDLETLRVIAFPGAPNLPLFAAVERGSFADHGVAVELELTPSSVVQAKRVAAGEFDIAFTAFDNVVAYGSGQGAAGPGVDPEYVVIMGGTQLDVSLVVDPAIEVAADLAGKSIALDALDTGFAFVAYEILSRAGVGLDTCELVPVGATPQRWEAVKEGTHDATLTIEPFTSIARANGFTILDSSGSLFESYQGGVVAARRAVLDDRRAAVGAFIDGYLEGLDWVLEPANRKAVSDLLSSRMDVNPRALEAVLDSVLSPESGLTPHAALLSEGIETVRMLRSKYGPGGTLAGIDELSDLGLWQASISARGA
jgi:ABC-type nitrate/sulfonate/bicarbonate transport system substrate-binding protein